MVIPSYHTAVNANEFYRCQNCGDIILNWDVDNCWAGEPCRDEPCEYDIYALSNFWLSHGVIQRFTAELNSIEYMSSTPDVITAAQKQAYERASIAMALPEQYATQIIDMWRALNPT